MWHLDSEVSQKMVAWDGAGVTALNALPAMMWPGSCFES